MKSKWFFATVIGLVMLPLAASAQQRTLTFKDALKLKSPRNVTVSEDGRYVAYTVRDVDFEESRFRSHIWILNTETGDKKQYTHGSTSESSPRFSPDGNLLAFTSSRKGPKSDEESEARNQLWIIPVTGGEATRLTSVQNGVSDYSWSRDGKEIFFTTRELLDEGALARRKKRKKLRYDEVEHQKIVYRREIWKVDIEDKKVQRIFEGMPGLAQMEPSPDGRKFAFTTNLSGRRKDTPLTNVWIYDIDAGEPRQLTSRHGAERSVVWSPNGANVLFAAGLDPQTSYSQTEYFLIPSNGGDSVNLTQDFNRSLGYPIFTAAGGEVVTTVAEGYYTHLYTLDITKKAMTPIIQGKVNISNVDQAEEAGKLVYTKQTGDTLPEIYLADLRGTNEKKLTDFNSQLEDYRIAKQEVITWNSKDGTSVEGLLVYPLDYSSGSRSPLIVSPHGGPHGRVTDRFNGEYQVWASKGYAVLSPNFRGSSGYGAEFDVANKKDIGFGDYEDVMSGVDKVIEMGIADPDRMGVQGGSYGGYMTNWIITHTDRFRGAVSKYGLWNLLTDWSNSNNPRWELNYLEAYYWDDMDLWLKHSPGTYVKNVTTPVLILHGDADPNTELANSREMYQALHNLGKTVELVIYPREDHGISGEPNHILDRQKRVVDWFAKYVLQEPDGYPVGKPLVEGDWELTVTGATVTQNPESDSKETKNVAVDLKIRHLGEENADFPLDLVHDVYLKDAHDREFSAIGIQDTVSESGQLIKTSSTTYTGRQEYSIRLVFAVPDGMTESRFKLKEFPYIALRF
jgi:dipeptidyl aminopeptidase/acylaminoacyl peptidase